MHNVDVAGLHWNDGWHFKRVEGGHVQVTRLAPGHEALQFRIPPLEWASIVAAVSPKGESSETWQQAALFHGGTQGYEYT